MLASCDQGTALGLRDLAVLTLLSRLGLRIGEVAGLKLEDIDWRRGEITVTGKGNRTERLPLPADVGTAIVSYLQGGRPRSGHREVFLCDRGPHRPMSRGAVTNVAARAAAQGRARCRPRPPPASQRRHGHAGSGGSLDEIGQVLRHRQDAHHRHLRESRRHGAAHRREALAWDRRRRVSPLREALAGYLSVRRALGFRLDRAEKLIGQFIDYLEERQATVITIGHVVGWATAPGGALLVARASRVRGPPVRVMAALPRPRP